jgi:hypothetical protein
VTETLDLQLALLENAPVPVTPELVGHLNQVEFCQPLYGVTGLEMPLRGCRDRALAIEDALANDFGSSLGYFPFYFADRGAITTGRDLNAKNRPSPLPPSG